MAWELLRGRSTLDSLLCSQREHGARHVAGPQEIFIEQKERKEREVRWKGTADLDRTGPRRWPQ